MRCTFFIVLFLLSVICRRTYGFTPTDCLNQLTKLDEQNEYTGIGTVYCAYIKNNSIREATFNIKNANIEDWDITIGEWDNHNFVVDSTQKPSIDKENDGYKVSINDMGANAIVWVLNKGSIGEISDVIIHKSLVKRDDMKECNAFENNNFIWRDISWDNTNEKSISNNAISLNNTVYLDTLALLFRKKNDNEGKNHYFTGGYTIGFKIKSDSPKWMLYLGSYDEKTKEVKICQDFDLEKSYPKISMNTEETVLLNNPDPENKCKINVIWWQNVKNDNNSQRIWLSKLSITHCENSDD